MYRFTISLNEDLARQLDELIPKKGCQNCAEAVRAVRHGRINVVPAEMDEHRHGHSHQYHVHTRPRT